jgi:Na+/melibiose symporter-like transporter
MPNLIIDAVEPARTGEATGFNALVRSVGSSLGSQVTAATLVAAGFVTVGAGPAARAFPAEAGFTTAFLIGALVALLAAGLAILIPQARPVHAPHLSPAEEIGVAAPLGEPIYGLDEVD